MKRAIISVTVFNFLAAGITFLINVLLARLFPYEVFGRINLLLSLSAILVVVLEFGFNNTLVIYYNKNKSTKEDKDLIYFINRKYLYFLLISLPILISFLFILNLYYDFSVLEFLFLIVTTFLASTFRYFITYYQAMGKWLKYNFLNLTYNGLKGVVLIIGSLIIFFILRIDLSYTVYLKLYILYGILLFLLGIIVSIPYLKINNVNQYDNKTFYKLLIPLGLTNIIIALSMRLDNLMIENVLGIKEVAIYSVANTLAMVFPLITGSIMRVFMKEMSNKSLYYLRKIQEIQKKYFIFLIVSIVIIILISPLLITTVFGEKYLESIQIFQTLVIVYIGGVFFTPLESYFYNEKPKTVLYLKLTQLLIIVTLSIPMLKAFSLLGMAITIVISRLIAWLFFSYSAFKITKNSNGK